MPAHLLTLPLQGLSLTSPFGLIEGLSLRRECTTSIRPMASVFFYQIILWRETCSFSFLQLLQPTKIRHKCLDNLQALGLQLISCCVFPHTKRLFWRKGSHKQMQTQKTHSQNLKSISASCIFCLVNKVNPFCMSHQHFYCAVHKSALTAYN